MASDTLTLALDGEITIADYSNAIQHLQTLVAALQRELVSPGTKVSWFVHELSSGSTMATLRGEAGEAGAVEKVVVGYINVGRSLKEQTAHGYGQDVSIAAERLTRDLNGGITSIRFETADDDVTLLKPSSTTLRKQDNAGGYGAVVGRVQTLTNRAGLRFTLYDGLHDKAVSCYLEDGKDELIRGLWGQRAIVHGWVTRDVLSGRPTIVRRIERLDPLPEHADKYKYLEARGLSSQSPNDPLPEDVIRQQRDAW